MRLYCLCICFGMAARYTGTRKAKWEQRGEVLLPFDVLLFSTSHNHCLGSLQPWCGCDVEMTREATDDLGYAGGQTGLLC